MINRIIKNEQRLDSLLEISRNLEILLNDFENSKKDYVLLNKYYGSKTWFKDKENFENNKITNIKAGVLSEDAVWNLDEEIKYLLSKMKNIYKLYYDEGSEVHEEK